MLYASLIIEIINCGGFQLAVRRSLFDGEANSAEFSARFYRDYYHAYFIIEISINAFNFV